MTFSTLPAASSTILLISSTVLASLRLSFAFATISSAFALTVLSVIPSTSLSRLASASFFAAETSSVAFSLPSSVMAFSYTLYVFRRETSFMDDTASSKIFWASSALSSFASARTSFISSTSTSLKSASLKDTYSTAASIRVHASAYSAAEAFSAIYANRSRSSLLREIPLKLLMVSETEDFDFSSRADFMFARISLETVFMDWMVLAESAASICSFAMATTSSGSWLSVWIASLASSMFFFAFSFKVSRTPSFWSITFWMSSFAESNSSLIFSILSAWSMAFIAES